MVGLVRKGRWREEARKSSGGAEVVVEVYQVGCLVRMPSLQQPHSADSEVVLGITHPWRLKQELY